ncbi:putative bzip-type transcription factor protein [Botrytis fragariae]|uniref:Putative bzip-type transcription factor protein n=1 Tax=Botrytis fragariae TaxID=1964551 RepID=A0A8H6EGC1_9HELO|nr:putative bzip-type transcription factor protein [Botrytis fragariae]KAF5871126.1 putative bzip-type transcription factor protein [Botrytis fragariae]
MADESQDASFTSFWHRSVDKISSQKVKFMPNITRLKTSKDENSEIKSGIAQKQHRRAQVRRAQIEHRQRKQNYVKHLEEDVIRLRGMIAKTEDESSALMRENRAIESTLSASGIEDLSSLKSRYGKLPGDQPINLLPPQGYEPLRGPTASDTTQEIRPTIRTVDYESENDRLSSYISDMLTQDSDLLTNYFSDNHDVPYSSTSSSSHINIQFDEFLNASCLHISELSDSSTKEHGTIDLSKPLPPLPGQVSVPANAVKKPSSDISLVAINFILALEHPCRTHFHHVPGTPLPFDPAGDPSGHELMASTHIFAQAPPEAFNESTSEVSWSSSVSLAQLYAMSQSLPTSDFEITPVQAWFMIAEKYHDDIEKVGGTKTMNNLKRGLGTLSRCYQFGAVMDVDSFWEIVGDVMTQNGS